MMYQKVPEHRLQGLRNLLVHMPKLEFQRMYQKVPETLIPGTFQYSCVKNAVRKTPPGTFFSGTLWYTPAIELISASPELMFG